MRRLQLVSTCEATVTETWVVLVDEDVAQQALSGALPADEVLQHARLIESCEDEVRGERDRQWAEDVVDLDAALEDLPAQGQS